jgi:ABC transporter substrate binding protein
MRRRDLIGVICGAALATPCNADAQQSGKVWRIGDVLGLTPERGAALAHGIEQDLADLGDIQGRNIVLTHQFAGPQPDKVRKVMASLLSEIDLLVAWGTIGGVAAKELADGVPTVFVSVGAPVEIGLVRSLAHPGGNMTGITFEAATETYGKRLQILKEIVPDLKRAAILRAVGDPNVGFAMKISGRGSPGTRDHPCPDRYQIGRRARKRVHESHKYRSRGSARDCWSPDVYDRPRDCRPRDRSPSPVLLCVQGNGYRRRASEPRPRCFRNDPSGSRANRQDHQRDQPSRHSRRAANEIRSVHQSENRAYAKPDHPANIARPR